MNRVCECCGTIFVVTSLVVVLPIGNVIGDFCDKCKNHENAPHTHNESTRTTSFINTAISAFTTTQPLSQ